MENESKKLTAEIQSIINEWDFIGAFPRQLAPEDEYDCLIDHLAVLTQNTTSKDNMRAFLIQEIEDHFGLGPNDYSAQGLEKALNKIINLQNKNN